MKKEISTAGAPAAIGPYSQGLRVGRELYLSGQIPMHPETGTVPDGITLQTERCLRNVQAILEAGGCIMDDAVEVTVFLIDMDDFPLMNKIYETFFSKPYPTRTTVEVARLPMDVLVEIRVRAQAQ